MKYELDPNDPVVVKAGRTKIRKTNFLLVIIVFVIDFMVCFSIIHFVPLYRETIDHDIDRVRYDEVNNLYECWSEEEQKNYLISLDNTVTELVICDYSYYVVKEFVNKSIFCNNHYSRHKLHAYIGVQGD